MKKILSLAALLSVALSLFVVPVAHAADPKPATPVVKPKLKITPGKVVVPTDAMRRPWGELISMDLATRTGTFRKDGTDEVVKFTAMPYAELLHHATFGDLQDFRVGERAIFRLHENEAGEWIYLTYIQDEMNFLKNHGEKYQVDSIDPSAGTLTVTQGNWDDPKLKEPFIRTKGIVIGTDKETRYWKNGEPATFADIKVGDRLRTKTHGTGKGNERVCWEVFFDDVGLLKFQADQKAVHTERLAAEGAPGYVDVVADSSLELTLFQEGGEVARALKKGQKVEVFPAGVDRKANGTGMTGVLAETKMAGNLGKVTVMLNAPIGDKFTVGGLARLKPVK